MRADRWYGKLLRTKQPTGKVQVEDRLRGYNEKQLRLPEHVLRLADAEYQRQFGGQQDYERMQERGGLGVLEVVALLADFVDRLGGKPTQPRSHK